MFSLLCLFGTCLLTTAFSIRVFSGDAILLKSEVLWPFVCSVSLTTTVSVLRVMVRVGGLDHCLPKHRKTYIFVPKYLHWIVHGLFHTQCVILAPPKSMRSFIAHAQSPAGYLLLALSE